MKKSLVRSFTFMLPCTRTATGQVSTSSMSGTVNDKNKKLLIGTVIIDNQE